jgi:ribosomal protein L37AE/L43A
MKKSISKSKVQRMRNIVTGNYNDKSRIQTGYLKTKKKHKEGDVWEEKGKTWTIKNGIRQNITKLDSIREATKMPYACPKCDEAMNHRLHDEVWPHFKMCYKCVNEVHKKIRREQGWSEQGWKDYVREIKKANFNDWLKDVKAEYEDWLDKRNSDNYITEAGDIESWGSGKSKEELKKEFNKNVEKLNKKVFGDKK